jgi:hypothetical protein
MVTCSFPMNNDYNTNLSNHQTLLPALISKDEQSAEQSSPRTYRGLAVQGNVGTSL